MGPRSHERGNWVRHIRVYFRRRASMGPRSHERGNGHRGFEYMFVKAGFNGAAFS